MASLTPSDPNLTTINLSPSDVSSMSSSGVSQPIGVTPSAPSVSNVQTIPSSALASPIAPSNPAPTPAPTSPSSSITSKTISGNDLATPLSPANPATHAPGATYDPNTQLWSDAPAPVLSAPPAPVVNTLTPTPNAMTPVDFTPPISTLPQTPTPPASTDTSTSNPPPSISTDQSGTAAAQITPPPASSYVPPPTMTAPITPPSASPLDETQYQQTLNQLAALAGQMAAGVDDPIYRIAANTAILSMGQMNEAQQAALQMKINSDPTLAGQGAGYAALASLAATNNSSLDQTMGSLSQASQARIQALQQFGLQEGLTIEQTAQSQAFNDATSAFNQAQTIYSDQTQNAMNNFSQQQSIYGDTTSQLNTNFDQRQTNYTDQINAAQTVFDNAEKQIADQVTAGQLTIQAAAELRAENAQNFQEAQDTAATTRNNTAADAATLENAGNFQGAANLLTASMNQQYPGSGIVITAAGLQANNTQSITEFNSQMQAITALAATDPDQAQTLLAPLLLNPAYAPFFPAGETAKDIVNGIVQGNTAQNVATVDSIQTEINTNAAAGAPFSNVAGEYAALFSAAGRNAVQIGQSIASTPTGLADINAIRASDGLSPFTADANGTILDDQGNQLTSDDYATLAYQQDYQSVTKQANAQPWAAAEKAILSGPGIQTMLSDSLYVGGTSGLASVLQQYFTNPANFTTNPDGTINYNTQNLQWPWNDPANYSQFYTFPTASFNADGTVSNPASIDLGGDAYGSTVNGQVITATPSEANLNNLYQAYVKSGNPANLTAQQWYFATSGGTTSVNTALLDQNFNDNGTTTTLNTLLKSPSNPANTSTNPGGSLTTPGATPSGTIDPVQAAALKNTFSAMTPAAAKTYLQTPANVTSLIQNQVLPTFNASTSIPTTAAAWDTIVTSMNGYLAVNGSPYQATVNAPILVGTSDDPNRFYYMPMTNVQTGQTIYMVVNASGSSSTTYPVGTAFSTVPTDKNNSVGKDNFGTATPFNQIGVTANTSGNPTPPSP